MLAIALATRELTGQTVVHHMAVTSQIRVILETMARHFENPLAPEKARVKLVTKAKVRTKDRCLVEMEVSCHGSRPITDMNTPSWYMDKACRTSGSQVFKYELMPNHNTSELYRKIEEICITHDLVRVLSAILEASYCVYYYDDVEAFLHCVRELETHMHAFDDVHAEVTEANDVNEVLDTIGETDLSMQNPHFQQITSYVSATGDWIEMHFENTIRII